MRDAGLKPDVDDVVLSFELRTAAFRTGETGRHERRERLGPPQIGGVCALRAAFAENAAGGARDLRVDERFAAIQTDERRQWGSPRALSRDAPLRVVLDHLQHPAFAPGRNP